MSKDPLRHNAEPNPWQTDWEYDPTGGTNWRYSGCRFCEAPIQRRGLFRRWKHVV